MPPRSWDHTAQLNSQWSHPGAMNSPVESLPTGYSASLATETDAPQVADLIAEYYRQLGLDRGLTPGEARAILRADRDDETRCTLVVCNAQELSAVAHIRAVRPHLRAIMVRGYVSLRNRGIGIGTYIAHWALSIAAGIATHSSLDGQVALRQRLSSRDIPARELLVKEGYRLRRTIHQMEMSLSREELKLPRETRIKLRAFDLARDYEEYVRLAREVNSENPAYVRCSLEEDLARYKPGVLAAIDTDCSLFAIARTTSSLVGYCIAEIKRKEAGSVGRICGFGVGNQYRRRGVGAQLLVSVLAQLLSRGVECVVLHVDRDNSPAAFRLYSSMGMQVTESDVVYEREIE